MTNEEIKLIDEYIRFCDNYDIKVRSVGIAQLMIESSHGKSDLSLHNNNPFGIKYTCDNCDYSVDYETKEHINGEEKIIVDSFGGYDTLDKCFKDYNRIVAPYNITCVDEYLDRLKSIGYATDPGYLKLIMDVMLDYGLLDYDIPVLESFKDLEDLITKYAYKVINGDYGNGETRKEKLGKYYTIIQDKVNELLS